MYDYKLLERFCSCFLENKKSSIELGSDPRIVFIFLQPSLRLQAKKKKKEILG